MFVKKLTVNLETFLEWENVQRSSIYTYAHKYLGSKGSGFCALQSDLKGGYLVIESDKCVYDGPSASAAVEIYNNL